MPQFEGVPAAAIWGDLNYTGISCSPQITGRNATINVCHFTKSW